MVTENLKNNTAVLDQGVGHDEEPTEPVRSSENRKEDRIDFRTTGLAYLLEEEGFQPTAPPIRIWTVDVSTMGCLVRSYEPIETERVLMKLFLPQLKETLIEAYIVRNLQDKAKMLNGKEQESHLYGVKFTKMMKFNELDVELPPPEENGSIQEEILLQEEEGSRPAGSPDDPPPRDHRVATVAVLTLASVLTLALAIFV